MSAAAVEATVAASIADAAQAVRRRRSSARARVDDTLARIGERNPALNAFSAVLADRARSEAAAVDAKAAAGHDPGLLAGVSFGAKDNYDLAGRTTTAGSAVNRALPPAAADAILVQRLTRAGAVLVGTHNMDEFAYGFTTENAHFGPTRSPLDPQRSAGGSSGGSAAAVAAGLCDFALGTDTNGSIRVPASFCGIFGLKPTFGRLPRTGTFPFVHDLDHLGVFARSVGDLALVYDVLQGHHRGDLACVRRRCEPTLPLLAQPFAGRVGMLGGWFEKLADDQGRDAVALVGEALGATDKVTLTGAAQARAAAFLLTCASGGNLHIAALRTQAGAFDPATRDRLLAGALLPANVVLQAQRYRTVFREAALEAFRSYDLLLAPATPCSAPLLGQPTIRVAGEEVPTRANIGLLTQPISFIGLPVVAAPMGNGSMPIGVQLIAPPWRENLALRAAAHLERAGVSQAVEPGR